MIVSQAPLRLPLGGGGTDLPEYYSKHKGFLISAAIDRHIYSIFHNRSIEETIKLKYSKIEIVKKVNQIEHGIIRECFKKYKIADSTELTSVADVGAGTGLGSSGAFTVSLLNALHAFKGNSVSPSKLAEEAFEIERKKLRLSVGKQDQYASAFGGIIELNISKNGKVQVSKLKISKEDLLKLQKNTLLFFTHYARTSNEILSEQAKKIISESDKMDAMHVLKQIGFQSKKCLLNGELNEFGKLLHEHWLIKKSITSKMSNYELDYYYDWALRNGALGGKIIGAGGGGFFMFYCPENQNRLKKALVSKGLKEMKFSFEPNGAKILLNTKSDFA